VPILGRVPLEGATARGSAFESQLGRLFFFFFFLQFLVVFFFQRGERGKGGEAEGVRVRVWGGIVDRF
jgi:hypothetical protein